MENEKDIDEQLLDQSESDSLDNPGSRDNGLSEKDQGAYSERTAVNQNAMKENRSFSSWFNIKKTKGKFNFGMLGIMLICFVVSIIIMLSIGVLGAIVIVAKDIIDAQGDVTDVMPIN